MPLGPYATEDERLRATHHRLERGTRCWLEKRCAKQSAYMYDRDIAAALRERFAASEKMLAAVPDVDRMIVLVSSHRRMPPPYRVLRPHQRLEN